MFAWLFKEDELVQLDIISICHNIKYHDIVFNERDNVINLIENWLEFPKTIELWNSFRIW